MSDLKPRLPDTEKITINVGAIDLGHIDLLVQEGFYSNRTDLIRTAIRNQLATHAEVLRQTVAHWGAKAATAVVLDPRTGAVLAMAQAPGYDANKAKGFVILGVAMDGPESVANVAPFARRQQLNFPVLLDEDWAAPESARLAGLSGMTCRTPMPRPSSSPTSRAIRACRRRGSPAIPR